MSDMVKMAVAGILALRKGSEAREYKEGPGGDREGHHIIRRKREFQREFLQYQEGYDPGGDVSMEQIRDITYS